MDLKLTLFVMRVILLMGVGLLFLLPILLKRKEDYDHIKALTYKTSLPIWLGILAILNALFGFFLPIDNLIILGDLIPDLILGILGVFLLASYVRIAKFIDTEVVEQAERLLDILQIPFGILALSVGLLHALLPLVPLL